MASIGLVLVTGELTGIAIFKFVADICWFFSSLVSDLIPLREVATWHSYMNIINTTGRSLGGPVGGWLTDQVGWRW
jgi:MFS family permease